MVEYPNNPICLVHGIPTTYSKERFSISFDLRLGLAKYRSSRVKIFSVAAERFNGSEQR